MTTDAGRYQTFTKAWMPWQRSLPNGTILLLDDDGVPLLALTPAAAEDLADSLRRQAGWIRSGKYPEFDDGSEQTS